MSVSVAENLSIVITPTIGNARICKWGAGGIGRVSFCSAGKGRCEWNAGCGSWNDSLASADSTGGSIVTFVAGGGVAMTLAGGRGTPLCLCAFRFAEIALCDGQSSKDGRIRHRHVWGVDEKSGAYLSIPDKVYAQCLRIVLKAE